MAQIIPKIECKGNRGEGEKREEKGGEREEEGEGERERGP
jgi:hypothetical protein